jgi:hypothetical protein
MPRVLCWMQLVGIRLGRFTGTNAYHFVTSNQTGCDRNRRECEFHKRSDPGRSHVLMLFCGEGKTKC